MIKTDVLREWMRVNSQAYNVRNLFEGGVITDETIRNGSLVFAEELRREMRKFVDCSSGNRLDDLKFGVRIVKTHVKLFDAVIQFQFLLGAL